VEEIESQLSAEPNSPDVVELLERMLQLSTPESEARVIERLLMHYPQHLGGLLRLFRRSSRRGTAKAIAEVFRAMAASVGSGQEYVALLQSASLFDVSTDLHEEEREKELWQIVELRPHDMSSLLRLLSGLSEGESRAERIKVFGALARGAQDESDKASHMLALARLLGDDTQYERAQLALDEVLRVAPRYEPAVRLLRIISEELGDHSRLADVMELQARASDDAGRSIEQWLRAAELRRKQLNDIAGAIAALQEVLTVDPQNEEAFASLQEIYSAQGRMGELFELLMERRHVLDSVEERRKTILRAAELAYNRMHDEERAVLAHRALLAQDPSFVRSYRVIAEIMEAKQRWREALEAHEGVLRSTKERALLARSWQRVGEILEDHLGDFEKASVAYRKALESQPESSDTLSRLARVFEQLKKWDDAVATLQWLAQVERVPLKRKEVLLRLSRLRLEHFADAAGCEEALVAAREIDPADMELTRELADAYAKRGWAKRREDFLRASYEEYRAHFQTNVSKPLALQAMYRLAEWLGDQDRKFCLASVLSFVGAADEQQQSHYKRTLEVVGRRLPSRALPAEKSAGVVASGLSVGMIHLMRQSEAAVAKVSPHSTRQRGVQRRFRVSPSARPDLALLVPFARVFGMDLPDIYLVPDRGESMTLLPGEELAFVMDERDLEPVMLPETMVRVAIGCASLSMGMACFARAEAELFEDYLLALFSCIFPGRRFYKAAKPTLVEGIGRHLTRKSLDSMSAYALELVEQLSAEFVGQQRLALLSTAMRLGLATSLDPRPGLTVIARDGDAGHFEVVPVMRDALLFLVNERYVEMRRETGVAVR
jgi:tetratricopeptide (TPR) repeat protein